MSRQHTAARTTPLSALRRGNGIALDIGSARTRLWIAGSGTLLDVPTRATSGDTTDRHLGREPLDDVRRTGRLLADLLHDRVPRLGRPTVVLTAPVLDGPAYREQARAAVSVLRPRAVVTLTAARAVALAAGEDLSRPVLVVDIGARLTEAVLLLDGDVLDARRTTTGTIDLAAGGTAQGVAGAVGTMITSMLRQDRTGLAAEAVCRGPLLAGGGALRPEVVLRTADTLGSPARPVPAPHTAAVRGAARVLLATQNHPSGKEHGTAGLRGPAAPEER